MNKLTLIETDQYFEYAQKYFNSEYHQLPQFVLDFYQLEFTEVCQVILVKNRATRLRVLDVCNELLTVITSITGVPKTEYRKDEYMMRIMKPNPTDIHKKTRTAPNYIMVMPVSNKSMLTIYNYDSRNKLMQVLVYGKKSDAQFGWFRDHNDHLTLSEDVNVINQYVDL